MHSKNVADVFGMHTWAKDLTGRKVLHGCNVWRMQNRRCKMTYFKSVLTGEEWRPVIKSVGGRFEINLHSTLVL